MQLHLCDPNPSVVAAWISVFRGGSITITRGDVFDDLPIDVLVTPVDSNGTLDGGIDRVYAARWPHIQRHIYEMIHEQHAGMLPIGNCVGMPTGDHTCPWLFIAPTMPQPMHMPNLPSAFHAMRAVLRLAKTRRVKTIVCPGLCTWSGIMDPVVSAMQIRLAWEAATPQPFNFNSGWPGSLL